MSPREAMDEVKVIANAVLSVNTLALVTVGLAGVISVACITYGTSSIIYKLVTGSDSKKKTV